MNSILIAISLLIGLNDMPNAPSAPTESDIASVCNQLIEYKEQQSESEHIYYNGQILHITGYRRGNPILPELYELSLDVLIRYEKEKLGETDVGRTLPKEYKFFAGSGGRNWFRQEYRSKGRWNWSLPDPYIGQ